MTNCILPDHPFIILVPQGAEYNAVCRGIKALNLNPPPWVLPIPAGGKAVTQYLEKRFYRFPTYPVLIMGVCGSLSPQYGVGDVVLYESCVYQGEVLMCDRYFTSDIYNHLKAKANLVKAVTSDSVVYAASEKHRLAEIYSAEVVDMEGFAVLKFLCKRGMSAAMLRVVSDDSQHNIPNLNSAIDEDGNLQPLPLAWEMITQPIAAFNLIKGSLQGLKFLEKVASELNI